jgi:hypothetical protein
MKNIIPLLKSLKWRDKFLKYTTRYFSSSNSLNNKTQPQSMTFKNKLNTFYKYVHPDVLGTNCPSDFKKNNERSMQELNSYLDAMEKGESIRDKKELLFYTKKTEEKGGIDVMYHKLHIYLEEIKPNPLMKRMNQEK